MALPELLPEFVTVEDFFGPPVRTAASLSPDGNRIAYLAPWRNRLNVWIEDLDGARTPRCVTADADRSVQEYHWTNDPRRLLYTQDNGGDENWHLYRVDLDAPDAAAVDLTPFPGSRVLHFEMPAERPGRALLTLNLRTLQEFDLHELDIATGEITVLAQNPGYVSDWVPGRGSELFATTMTASGDFEFGRWDSVTGTLHPLLVFDGTDYPMGVYPVQLTPDGTGVWIGSNRGTDRTRVVRVDLASGAETEVDSHPTFDLDTRPMVNPALPPPLILDRRTGELIGARYLRERQVIRPLDPLFAEVLENLSALSDGDLAAISSDESGRRWVVSFTHDRDPGRTYFYDHTTGESRLLFRPFPHLDPATLAPMTPVTVPSRDGLELPCHLTLPVGVEPCGLPMVVQLHGGPWFRDSWGYSPGVQLLANRGYAVLQVNFRGSTGYGKAFVEAAVGEFAGRMHDDVIDAVNWAVGVGYADPDRVAIFGGSYGGYAALVGVTRTPDIFAAAVDYVGISDLAGFMRTIPEFGRRFLVNNFHRFVGDPDDPEQAADIAARSPIYHLDRIRTPLLVIQGANDVRVVRAQSDDLVEELRARGVEVEYMVKEDEGHGFVNPDNQIDMYRAIERFLARHLGSGAGEQQLRT
ncbi:S9 family peptidase [Nocardia sp. NBC_01329]|uniref:S9 family peptidase n=1 Tax=Nocardia sp. NBC_01329 TaxID=2903594 RepID=UPI002E0FD7A3|nr:S9 family peptidase [Nocardia sp. NBC_01329]